MMLNVYKVAAQRSENNEYNKEFVSKFKRKPDETGVFLVCEYDFTDNNVLN